MSIIKFPQKSGVLRKVAYSTLATLNEEIRGAKSILNRYQFLTKQSSIFKGKKNLREFPKWGIVGIESPSHVKKVRESFVLPFKDEYLGKRSKEETANILNKYTGKNGLGRLNELLKVRKKLGTSIMEKEIAFNKSTKAQANRFILDKKHGFPEEVRSKLKNKILANKRIEMRAKGYRFVRIRGRIVPIKVSNER